VSFNATGPLFDYMLQFPRALLRLLEADTDAKIGIEVYGDISVQNSDGTIISEEDKSSLTRNVLSDKSTNLWKTFYNWIMAINDGVLNADRDYFVLYTNHSVFPDSFVKQFHNASNDTVDKIIVDVKKKMEYIKKEHELYKYITVAIGTNIEMFKKILLRFDLVEDRNADEVYDVIRNKLINMAFENDVLDDILHPLTGWLQETIMKRIAQNNSAIITKEEFFQYFYPLARKIRQKTLITKLLQNPIRSLKISVQTHVQLA
jgi:hypothetical protein